MLSRYESYDGSCHYSPEFKLDAGELMPKRFKIIREEEILYPGRNERYGHHQSNIMENNNNINQNYIESYPRRICK